MNSQKSMPTFLSPGIAVGSLMTLKTLRLIKTLGFSSVINALPEDSVFSNRNVNDLAAQVRDIGLQYLDLGAGSTNQIDDSTIARFRQALEESPKPVFVFSKSGSRATALWAAVMAETLNRKEIKAAAARAGHDVSFLTSDPEVSAKQVA